MQKRLVRALGVLFLVSFEVAPCADITVPKSLESARVAITRQIEQGHLPSAAIA